jgi:hypothetical protein
MGRLPISPRRSARRADPSRFLLVCRGRVYGKLIRDAHAGPMAAMLREWPMTSRLAAWAADFPGANRGVAPLVPLGIMMVLALVLVAGAAWQAAARLDQAERASEVSLVRNALDGELETLARNARQLAQSATEPATGLRLHRPGTDLLRLAHDIWDYEFAFILETAGRTVLGLLEARQTALPAEQVLGPQLSSVLRDRTVATGSGNAMHGLLRAGAELVAVAVAPSAADSADRAGAAKPVPALLVLSSRLDWHLLTALSSRGS